MVQGWLTMLFNGGSIADIYKPCEITSCQAIPTDALAMAAFSSSASCPSGKLQETPAVALEDQEKEFQVV